MSSRKPVIITELAVSDITLTILTRTSSLDYLIESQAIEIEQTFGVRETDLLSIPVLITRV